jgi:gluconokinase
MSIVAGLRSPYSKAGRLVYFGRMLDKIRLHSAGKLPADEYAANLGKGFDSRCCGFLRVDYGELKSRVLGGTEPDEAVLAWAEERGGRRPDLDCELWNAFMMKRGFRDDASATLAKRIQEGGFEGKPIMTMFDYIDFDEGRDPVSAKAWEGGA